VSRGVWGKEIGAWEDDRKKVDCMIPMLLKEEKQWKKKFKEDEGRNTFNGDPKRGSRCPNSEYGEDEG